MVREFSEEKKEELYRILTSLDDSPCGSFLEWCGSRRYEFGDWMDRLSIPSYMGKIDQFETRITDMNASIRSQIDTVFSNVYAIDRKYGEIFQSYAEIVKGQIARVQAMTGVMRTAGRTGLDKAMVLFEFEMEEDSMSDREKKILSGQEILVRRLEGEGISPAECKKICDMIMKNNPSMLLNLYITDSYSGVDSGRVYSIIKEYYEGHKNDEKLDYAEEILRIYLTAQGIVDDEEQQDIIDMIRTNQPGMLLNLYITDCYSSADSKAVEKAIMDYYKRYGEEPDTPLYNYTKEMVGRITATNSDMDAEVQRFAEAYENNKNVYIELSKATGVPPEVLAVIHYRENTSDYLNGDFQVYLHNGQRLGEVTTVEPKDILYEDFYTAAIDAIERKDAFIEKYHLNSESDDIVAMMCFLEVYNGLGYFNNDYISPYSYSGTNLYVSGKYVEEPNAEGKMVSVYHPELVDKQVGSYLLLKGIMEE